MTCGNYDCRQARLKADEAEKQLRARVAQLEEVLKKILAPQVYEDGTWMNDSDANAQQTKIARAAPGDK